MRISVHVVADFIPSFYVRLHMFLFLWTWTLCLCCPSFSHCPVFCYLFDEIILLVFAFWLWPFVTFKRFLNKGTKLKTKMTCTQYLSKLLIQIHFHFIFDLVLSDQPVSPNWGHHNTNLILHMSWEMWEEVNLLVSQNISIFEAL